MTIPATRWNRPMDLYRHFHKLLNHNKHLTTELAELRAQMHKNEGPESLRHSYDDDDANNADILREADAFVVDFQNKVRLLGL